MTQRESSVQHAILTAWGAHPSLRIARVNTGAAMLHGRLVRFGVPGTADIVGILAPHGRMLMIECKSAKGKQRRAQEAMQRAVTRFGGLYIVARSLADVDAAFAALGVTRTQSGLSPARGTGQRPDAEGQPSQNNHTADEGTEHRRSIP